MKYFVAVCVSVFLISFSSFAQKINTLKHNVVKGETITQIAQKYKVTPFDIYELNPDAKNGVQLNSVLLIPVLDSKSKGNGLLFSKYKTHEVTTKETIYSIAKQYNVSIEDLESKNAEVLKEGLQIGQTLIIPTKQEVLKATAKLDQSFYHEVLPKETKYSIATQHGITVEQLEKWNPGIESNLAIGYQLIVKENSVRNGDFTSYEVQPKETLYSLTKKFELSPNELQKLNPQLTEGVKEGMILKIPSDLKAPKSLQVEKGITNLSKSISNQEKKELVLLLPFNVSKIPSDSIKTIASRLKKDKFLNMTLDFYSGVMMAIDSAKTIGLNVNIKILDSEETKNSSNVAALIPRYNLLAANAIIGPFYQSNVDKVAEMVSVNQVPVISPLSKESGKTLANVYQSMPSNECAKNVMLSYLNSKEANLLAIIDPKKIGLKDILSKNAKEIKLIGFSDKGAIVKDSLQKRLVRNKMNYVILDSQKTGVILASTNALISLMKEFQIQLVILEANPTLDFEEIPISSLTKLKMIYPSLIFEKNNSSVINFGNSYKKKNKIFPNQFATRGFDITFDTLLRLAQEQSFEESIMNTATEQVESKFDYSKDISGGVSNKGVYILYYDTDMTIKQAK
jgi:LysM repeat protein